MANGLSPDEKKMLDLILEDLKLLFQLDVIPEGEIDRVVGQLRSDEVRAYVTHLRSGSKPEVALREAFFAGRSILSKYLAADISPEVNLGEGFIDYQIGSSGRFILLELKTLFEAEIVQGKVGRELKVLKQRPLKWKDHKAQVLKYIRKGGEYIVLTNLKEWYFFNDECGPDRCEPFYTTELFSFLKDFEVSQNLYERLERYDLESIREELDKQFFESLRAWVKKLSEVEFDVDEKRKLEIIISLINRFVFIQTLDDYGVIDFRWIKNAWDHAAQRWSTKGKLQVLKEFFREVNEWFYEYYDTELFRNKVLEHVKQSSENIDLFYRNLELVLGLAYWQTPLGGFKGIMQYKFKFINEDIFGKAYETFLAEVRKEQGIFYTPRYITEYIVESTVGRMFDELLRQIKKELEAENFELIPPLIERFKSIRVLDPACGSGSFLIKATRKIFEKYQQLYALLTSYEGKYDQFNGTLFRSQDAEDKAVRLMQIREAIVERSYRELISKILVRHIHGNDLDAKALEVAKVNLWLEAIKLAPNEFRFDRLPSNTNHVLPSLTFNLCNGDALVGLPEQALVEFLREEYLSKIVLLCKLRQEYLLDPSKPELIDKIEEILAEIRRKLDERFREYLEKNKISLTILQKTVPLHWPLEFWYFFFAEDGTALPEGSSGPTVIIGNPPYGRIKQLIEGRESKIAFGKYYAKRFVYQHGNFNYYKLFIEKSFSLLKEGGRFSMIFPSAFLGELDSQPLRQLLFENTQVDKILQFPEQTHVFEDVTQDVTVIVYEKSEPDASHKIKLRTNITKDELKRLNQLDFLEISVSDIREIVGRSYRIPLLTRPEEEWQILRILSKIPKFSGNNSLASIGQIGVGHLDETFDKEYLSEKPTGEMVIKGIHLTRYFVNLDPDGPQPRWVRKEEFFKKKPEAEKNTSYERIIGRNTLNRSIRPRLLFTLLPPGYVITNAIKYIIPSDDDPDFKRYVIGLLNSSLLNWRFELFSAQNNIRNYEIEDLPFARASKDVQREISRLVEQIMQLKQIRHLFLKLWQYWSVNLKNDETTMMEILKNDVKLFAGGRFAEAWTRRALFYPTEENEILTKEFKELIILGSNEQSTIFVFGWNGHSAKPIYEIELPDRDVTLHLYICFQTALDTLTNIRSLAQLLNKTNVPIIKEVNKPPFLTTSNIIRKVKQDIQIRMTNEQMTESRIDLVKIDNEIEDLNSMVDALVYRLYGLGKEQAKLIINSLGSPLYNVEKVQKYLGD